MRPASPIKSAAWAAVGAALMGGGMLLGFASALVRRRDEAAEAPASKPAHEPVDRKRIDELAHAVAEIERRLECIPPAPAAGSLPDRVEAVDLRLSQLETRMDQLLSETAAVPPIDQVLAAVEQMVAAKVGGLDRRLTDQVHAIELLSRASAQTDALLQKLLTAVETLSEQAQAAEQNGPSGDGPPPDYPIA